MIVLRAVAFEPGSMALAAYLLQKGVTWSDKKPISLAKMKRFSKKHEETLKDIAVEELSSAAVDLLNAVHLPHACSISLGVYLFIFFVTILV